MASESREDGVPVNLPADLEEWLDERTADLGVSRSEIIRQLLASYRAADSLDGTLNATELLDLEAEDFVAIEESVEERLDEGIDDRIDDAVAEQVPATVEDRVDESVEAAVANLLPDVVEAVLERIEDRFAEAEDLSAMDDRFQEMIEDVRERVIQVKRETDAKAPADHTHEELARIESLEGRLSDLTEEVETLRYDLEEGMAERQDEREDVQARLDDLEDKLTRVAWTVTDLKENTTGRDAHDEALDRIRRAAAQENASTAKCESCGEAVEVGLLTDPECPHCNATVTDVRPGGGFFRSTARLVTAAQLESGEGEP